MKTIQDEFPLGAKVRLTKECCEGIVVGYEDSCVLVALPLEGHFGWIPELDDNRLESIDIRFSSNNFYTDVLPVAVTSPYMAQIGICKDMKKYLKHGN